MKPPYSDVLELLQGAWAAWWGPLVGAAVSGAFLPHLTLAQRLQAMSAGLVLGMASTKLLQHLLNWHADAAQAGGIIVAMFAFAVAPSFISAVKAFFDRLPDTLNKRIGG